MFLVFPFFCFFLDLKRFYFRYTKKYPGNPYSGVFLVGKTEKCWPHIVLNMVLYDVSGGKTKSNGRFLILLRLRNAKK